MLYGVAYYPENWSKERMIEDANLMKEARFNVIRMAEFTWSKLEPSEGVYNFEWLDEAIELFAKHDIKTILCTPTATPPKWLMDKHPEIYAVNRNGERFRFGGRRHYCSSSEIYRKYINIIVTKMMEKYAQNKNVIAWQIDNEFGGDNNARCYCDSCKQGFRQHLKNKFDSIESLNNAWGTQVWSQGYGDFDQVELPNTTHCIGNPSLAFEYFRYMSKTVVEFQNFQIDIIKKYTSEQKITTNLHGTFSEMNTHELTKTNDFISSDFYPNLTFERPVPHKQAMAVDMCISDREKQMVRMEQQSGMPGGDIMFPPPKKGDLARWAYQSIAHGCDGIVFFRWHTNVYGPEQHWHGILGHDGVPRRLFNEAKQMGLELESVSKFIEGTKQKAEVAIVHDYEVDWVFEIQPHHIKFNHIEHVEKYYKVFYELGIPVDIVSKDMDLKKYKLLVLPNHSIVDDNRAKLFEEYVNSGGHVLFDFRSGVRNENNVLYQMTPPGKLSKLLGIEIVDYGIIGDYEDVNIVSNSGIEGKCSWWFEEINTVTAKSMAVYKGDAGNETSAVTCNEFGKGLAWYLGTVLNDDILETVIYDIVEKARIKKGIINRTKDVEVITRENEDRTIIFMINHSNEDESISIGNNKLMDLLDNKQVCNECSLKPRQVKIFSLV